MSRETLGSRIAVIGVGTAAFGYTTADLGSPGCFGVNQISDRSSIARAAATSLRGSRAHQLLIELLDICRGGIRVSRVSKYPLASSGYRPLWRRDCAGLAACV